MLHIDATDGTDNNLGPLINYVLFNLNPTFSQSI